MLRSISGVAILRFVLTINLYVLPINGLTVDMPYRDQMSFDNRTRLITTVFHEPFMMLKKSVNSTLSEKTIARGTILDPSMVEGYCADLAYAICHEKLKIPYKFVIETKYGIKINEGVWDGMIGELMARRADMAVAAFLINVARTKVVDFSHPFIDAGISMMALKPEKSEPGVFSVLAPFSMAVWIGILFSYILVTIILFIIDRFSSYERYSLKSSGVATRQKCSVYNALFCCCDFFNDQGIPYSIANRVAISFWWFFSFIIFSWYIANLLAFTSAERLVVPIETIEDLARQTDIRYGVSLGGSTMAFFNHSTQPVMKTMWNSMLQYKDDVFVRSTQEGIEKVRRSKGLYIFFLESTMNEYINTQRPCDTMRIGTNIDSRGYGIATPHGSNLREAVNSAVLELIESGFLNRLKHKWYYERSQCTDINSKDSKVTSALTLSKAASIFYLLFFGLSLAIMIALVEFFFRAKRESVRLNQNICKVMHRHLCIAFTGNVLSENQQQKHHTDPLEYRSNLRRDEQPPATTTAIEPLKSNDPLINNQD